MEDLIILAGSALGVALLVGAVWLAGFRDSATIAGAESLAPLLAGVDPEARIEELALDPKGRRAVARVSGARVLLAVSMGADIAVRVAPLAAAQVRLKRRKAVVSVADVGFPPLAIAYSEGAAPPLLRALSRK